MWPTTGKDQRAVWPTTGIRQLTFLDDTDMQRSTLDARRIPARLPAQLKLIAMDAALGMALGFGTQLLATQSAPVDDWGAWLKGAAAVAVYRVAPELLSYMGGVRTRIQLSLAMEAQSPTPEVKGESQSPVAHRPVVEHGPTVDNGPTVENASVIGG